MSRIYHALKNSDADRSAALLQLIDDDHIHASVDATDESAHAAVSVVEEPPFVPFHLPPIVHQPEIVPVAAEPPAEDHAVDPPELAQTARSVVAAIAPLSLAFPFGGSDPRASEQYRILRTNIVQHELAPKIIGVTSAAPGDGKTITAINVAGILALKGEARVLLIDADLRQRTLAKTIGIPVTPGLTDVIRGDASLADAVVQIDQLPGLCVLPSGTASGNPSELLDSPLFRAMVDGLRGQFSYVVFDTTPMTAVTDFKLVQQICDGVLVVIRPDHTNRAAFSKAMQVQQKEKFLGTVINAVEDWFLWNSNDHYKYYSSHSTGSRRPASRGVVVKYKNKTKTK